MFIASQKTKEIFSVDSLKNSVFLWRVCWSRVPGLSGNKTISPQTCLARVQEKHGGLLSSQVWEGKEGEGRGRGREERREGEERLSHAVAALLRLTTT